MSIFVHIDIPFLPRMLIHIHIITIIIKCNLRPYITIRGARTIKTKVNNIPIVIMIYIPFLVGVFISITIITVILCMHYLWI